MKKLFLGLLMILTIGVLSACGMSEEDAAAYVKASLDAAYKGEFEDFVEITDSTPEGAQAIYEENIVHTMEAAGFSDMELSDELTEKYRQLFLDISYAANYSVGDAKKTDAEGYNVEVEIYPVILFNEVNEETITKAVLNRIDDMKKYPGEKKITEITFEEIYNTLSEKIKDPKYSEDKVNVTVTIHKNEEGMYYISEEDMLNLDKVMFELNKK